MGCKRINLSTTRPIKTNMSPIIKGGSPVRVHRSEEESMEKRTDTESFGTSTKTRRSSKGPWILLGVIIIALVVLGVVFKDSIFGGGETGEIASSEFQGVFLTNGQVYFGKLSDVNKDYVRLENIYYLQITPVLQTRTEGEPGTPPPTPQQQLSLVKLGNELHGPVDMMFINRDHILFIEDLKEDGRVVQAIRDFEEGKKKEE